MQDNRNIHKNARGLYTLRIAPIEKNQDGKFYFSLAHGHAPEMNFMQMDGVRYSKESLNKMHTRIQYRYKTRATEPPPTKAWFDEVVIGGLVVAKYQLDGRFYRAMVIDIYEEPILKNCLENEEDDKICDKSFLVYYIDYGNVEIIYPGQNCSTDKTAHCMFPLEVEFITDEPARAIPISIANFRSVMINFADKTNRKYLNDSLLPSEIPNFSKKYHNEYKDGVEFARNALFVRACEQEDVNLSKVWINFVFMNDRSELGEYDCKNKNGDFAFRNMKFHSEFNYLIEYFENYKVKREREEEIAKKNYENEFISYEENTEMWQYTNTEFGVDLEDYFNDIRVKTRGRQLHFRNKLVSDVMLKVQPEKLEPHFNTGQNRFNDSRALLNALTAQTNTVITQYNQNNSKKSKVESEKEFRVSEWLKNVSYSSDDDKMKKFESKKTKAPSTKKNTKTDKHKKYKNGGDTNDAKSAMNDLINNHKLNIEGLSDDDTSTEDDDEDDETHSKGVPSVLRRSFGKK